MVEVVVVVVVVVVVEEEDIKDNDDRLIDYDTVIDEIWMLLVMHDDTAWYDKALLMIDWTNKFSCLYCVYPSFVDISIDKIMKLFKGWSNMTHIMKCNIPIYLLRKITNSMLCVENSSKLNSVPQTRLLINIIIIYRLCILR